MLLILSRQCSPLVWLRLFILVGDSRSFTNSNLNDCNLIKITSLTPLTNMLRRVRSGENPITDHAGVVLCAKKMALRRLVKALYFQINCLVCYVYSDWSKKIIYSWQKVTHMQQRNAVSSDLSCSDI